MSVTPLGLQDVLSLSADPGSRRQFSALSEQPFLLFDADAAMLPVDAQQRLAAWLMQLPCPTLGIANGHSVVSPVCDVVLESAAEAAPLITTIRKSPVASGVFVQLLRATEHMPVEIALTAESLAYSTLQAGPEFRAWIEANRAAAPAQHSDAGSAVLIERSDDMLQLTLNRASNRNAMTVEMRDALVEALELVLGDDSIREVRIEGRGKCFSTGGDLTEFGSAPDPATAHLVRSLALPGRLLARCADRVSVRVHGACIGSGIEFPAFAGRITAAPDAWFQLPEVGFGLIPGAGGCISIARRIGRQRLAWMGLGGKRIDAQRALEWKLVDSVAA